MHSSIQPLVLLWIRFVSTTSMVKRSNPAHQLFFIFQLQNILRSYLNLSTSYGRLTDLRSSLGLLVVSFIWLREKNSLKY